MDRFQKSLLLVAGLAPALLATTSASAITRSEVMARAQQWVDVGLKYCVAANGAYDSACNRVCERQSNPEWDPYRSDCSGLIAWSWAIPPNQQPYTGSLAPYGGTNTFVIAPEDLQPGDALNDRTNCKPNGTCDHHHVMLFGGWVAPGVARILQEPGCTGGAKATNEPVKIANGEVTVGKWSYTPIRFTGITGDCQAHCEGSKIFGADCNVGDCGVYGATCTDDSLGVRCVYTQCPPTGTQDVCLDQNLIAKCVDGLPQAPGDCSAYAAYCSLAGGTAHCASAFCAKPTETPIAHTGCFIDGSIKHCDAAGVMTTDKCPDGTKCSVFPEPHCEANTGCPPTGDVRLCLEGRAVRCYEGTLAEVADCVGQGRECVVSDGYSGCSEENTGDSPPPEAAGAGGSAAGQSGAGGSDAGQSGAGAPPAGQSGASGQAAGGAASGSGGSGQSGGSGGSGQGATGQSGGSGGGGGKAAAGGVGQAGGSGAGSAGKTPVLQINEPEDSEGGCRVSPRGGQPLAALALVAAALARVARRRR